VGAVDLIKLDVDGYECDVIEGSSITLSRNRPVILVELAPFILKAAGRDIFELVERLEAHDYTLLDLRGRRRVRARDVERLAQQNASMNVIAQPDALGSSERLR
jgi:hypothetical protein